MNQTYSQKIQQQHAQADVEFATAQKSLSALKKECADIGASTTQLLTDLEAEKIALQRAQKTLIRSKAQAKKQLTGAKALVSSKETELTALKKQASELQTCIGELKSSHQEAEAAMKLCTAESERLSADMQREEAEKKKAVLQAFDRKQEVETIKAQIIDEKVCK